MTPGKSVRTNRYIWLGLLVVLVGLLVLGAGRPPSEGVSEDRLYAIADDMKCVACVGESVANSQASIAIKMRSEIREQMDQGKSDDEIFSFFVSSYGQRVLLNPPASGVAALVWVIPVLVIAAAAVVLAAAFGRARSSRVEANPEATEEDRRLVDAARRNSEAAADDPVASGPAADGPAADGPVVNDSAP